MAHHRRAPFRRGVARFISIVFDWSRTSTTPPTQRSTSLLTLKSVCGGRTPVVSTLVQSRVWVLVWISSELFAAGARVGR